jgi:PAS domain S-box-containing protein
MAEEIRVLLVDDDPSYHTLTSRMLARADQEFKVDWVGTYSEGLETIARDEHDVYLIDYNLGSSSGLDLMKEALERGITAPVIMMTGHGKHGLDVEALKVGATDYIDKVELRPAALQRSIRYAMERSNILRSQRESEEMHRSLIENAFDGIIITDTEGKISLINQSMLTLLQMDEATAKQKSLRDLVVAGKKDILDVGEGGIIERQLRRADGSLLDVEVSAKKIDESRLQFVVRDISGRKQSIKERDKYIDQLTVLRQVDEEISHSLNIAYVLSMVLDAAVRLSGADEGFIGVLDEEKGLTISQAIGHYANLMSDDNKLPESPMIQKVIAEQEPRLILDVKAEPDYTSIHDTTHAQMLLPLLSYEKVTGIINLETRKSDRFDEEVFDFLKLIAYRAAVAVENARLYQVAKKRYDELQELYTQVSNLEQLKTDMIRIAAHDIRNPVSVVLGYTELMEAMIERNNTERLRHYIKMVDGAARRMEKITTDILSLERIENQKDEANETIDISKMVRETFEEFEGQAGLKSQELKLELPDTPLHIRGDAAQMREAAANLVSNAIKYTPENGTIRIVVEGDPNKATFKVIDNGFGIPEEQQKNLFQPFFRASSQETKEIEGTGLGLYLIKNIVQRHKGDIIFSSTYGEGSTFGFWLPVVELA